MSKAAMEIDFLGLEEGDSSSQPGQEPSSSRGPAATVEERRRRLLAPSTPLGSTAPSRSAAGSSPRGVSAPLTIFYNGTVTTFHLPQDEAEAIIKWTEMTSSEVDRRVLGPAADAFMIGGGGRWQQPPPLLMDKMDLPLARKRSLQRFLEMRKERY